MNKHPHTGMHTAAQRGLRLFANRTGERIVVLEIHAAGVDQRDARLQRSIDRGAGFRLVRRAVKIGHAHRAEADS